MDPHTTKARKKRLKLEFSSITTSYRSNQPFEPHYYYLHDNAKNPVTDIVRDKLMHCLPRRLSCSAQERLYRSKEFGDGKPPAEVSPLVDNLVRLLIFLITVAVLVPPMCITR